jgi:hypothetical protein
VEVILTEGLAAEGMEVVPVIIVNVEQAQIPLFIRNSNPENSSGSNSDNSGDAYFWAMDMDATLQ